MSARGGPDRGLFDLWSRFYDLAPVQRLAYRPPHDAVLEALGDAAPRRVLDVGCGTGMLAQRLRSELGAKQVVGCDFSPGMLRRGAQRDPGVGWVQGDALRLPFAAASFAALVSTEAFHWFPDQRAALAEFRRVLEPRGTLLLALIHPRVELARQLTRAGSRWLGEPLHWPLRSQLRGWLAQAGFRVEAQRRIVRVGTLLLFPTHLTVAKREG